MEKNYPAQSPAIGILTPRERVHMRARELALMAGRVQLHVTQTDYEQAKREITGESDAARQEAILDAINEIKPWNPVPGPIGRQTPGPPAGDEDAEGRSESGQPDGKGAGEAGKDRMRRAARATARREQSEEQASISR
jgi:hypothetical protein